MAQERISCDVAIVGAGPAGTAAARAAAKTLDVLILEKSDFPRYKTCGGGILARTVRLLGETELPIAERTCFSAQFVLSSRLRFCARRDEPIVHMTMRDRFDDWLMQKAIGAGAKLITKCAVQKFQRTNGRIMLSTSRGEISARCVVAADGAGGPTARLAGWGELRHCVPALECEVHVAARDFDRFSESARFDFEPVPFGYGWVFPKKEHLSIGVLTLNPRKVSLHNCFANYLSYLGIENPLSIQRHGYVIPLRPRASVLARDGVLLVGDAAGLADPVTAEGITAAVQSGHFAGCALDFAKCDKECVSLTYQKRLEVEIYPELRWARRLAHLLYLWPGVRNRLFSLQGDSLTNLMTDIATGKRTYQSLLAQPANYLKLLGR
jgi:geranylgeranyl reductase family protein